MNELQIFGNPKFGQIRMIQESGKVLFVASDVARALGYIRPNDAINQHCRYTVKHSIPHPQSSDKSIEVNVIPEGDIYRLAAKSELPGADEFESWIYDDVLPSIRKHGMYAADELLDNPDLLIQVATELKKAREEKKLLQAENKLLAGQALTWSDRKILEAIVKKYGAHIDKTKTDRKINGFQEAWREFKKELLYAHSINLNARISKYMETSGRKTAPKTLDMIHEEELSACISTAVALCNRNGVDISEILKKVA